ncbi:MAG: cytochrome c [Gemmatimonadetes bacterium]|nr:cytochrome c [Gemmatimonadota bacterium]
MKRTEAGSAGAAIAVALALAALPAPAVAQVTFAAAEQVTFAKDVAPILYQNCVECHRPGSFAPMSLLTYEEARRYARQIRYRVSERQMPPWHVDKTLGIQDFANDVSLSDEEIATIVAWVDNGTARGNDADMPPVPEFGDGRAWQAELLVGRPPDLIVKSSPYTVPARGQDQWWNPTVKWEALGEDRYLLAYEFKPAYPHGLEVVHHGHASLVFPSDQGVRGGVGIAHYGVGKGYEVFADGVGMRIPAGEGIVDWNIHYSSLHVDTDTPDDVVEIGLWFYPRGETPELATEGEVLFRVDRENGYDRPMNRANDILIPPNGYQVLQGVHVLEEPALIGSFRPHLHTRGKEMSMEAIYPDGRREVIGKVSDYKHIWQVGYEYAEDSKPLLPKGTVLLFTSVFDNTADNPLNPDPNQWVVFGRRGPDEMSHMWVNITYLSEGQYEEIRARREARPIAQAN